MPINTDINDAVSGLFSLSGLVAFLLGLVSFPVFYWVKGLVWDKEHPDENRQRPRIKSLWFLWSLIFIYSFFIGIQQQKTADDLTTLTRQTAACQREFFSQLKGKFDAGEETDKWSNIKTRALDDWLHDILNPPGDMAERRAKDPRDPVYQAWAFSITGKYDGLIQQAEKEQEASLEERKSHPLPEPTCGK